MTGNGEKLYHDYGILAQDLVEHAGTFQDADSMFTASYQWSMVALAKMVKFYR